MIPPELTGGWVRRGIAWDGAEPAEDALVWWLQAPSQHCDLRVPFQGTASPMAFAGTTTWTAPRLTWTPALELDPSVFEDVGVISWDGEDLLEAGTAREGARDIAYVERWARLPGSAGDQLALRSADGRLVRTGRYALTIVDRRPSGGSFDAVAWVLEDERWTAQHCWPPGARAPAPPLSVKDGDTTVRLDDGTDWTIDEHRKAADTHGIT